jgi:ketosteroid isomerase-like protein
LDEKQANADNLRELLKSWDPRADLEAWKRGEPRDLSLFDSEIAYEDTVLPDHVGEVYRGIEGVARATERWIEPFETVTMDLERIVGSGDRFVSVHRFRARARHTGMEFEESLAYIWTFKDGKVVHFKSYWDPADALQAAGLDEPPVP